VDPKTDVESLPPPDPLLSDKGSRRALRSHGNARNPLLNSRGLRRSARAVETGIGPRRGMTGASLEKAEESVPTAPAAHAVPGPARRNEDSGRHQIEQFENTGRRPAPTAWQWNWSATIWHRPCLAVAAC
jgi:hypothetical protein